MRTKRRPVVSVAVLLLAAGLSCDLPDPGGPTDTPFRPPDTTTTSSPTNTPAPGATATATAPPTATATATTAPQPTATPTDTPYSGDLRVTDLTSNPAEPEAAVPFHLLAVVHNDSAVAVSNVALRIENHFPHPHASCDNMDMTNSMLDTTVNLGAGQSLLVDYVVQIDDAWAHMICIKVDPDGLIAETDESNNWDAETILVGMAMLGPLGGHDSGLESTIGEMGCAGAALPARR